jgi:hypothetical protein
MGGVYQLERDLIRMVNVTELILPRRKRNTGEESIKHHQKHTGINYAVKLYREGKMTVKQICGITNVSRSVLYRRLSEVGKN